MLKMPTTYTTIDHEHNQRLDALIKWEIPDHQYESLLKNGVTEADFWFKVENPPTYRLTVAGLEAQEKLQNARNRLRVAKFEEWEKKLRFDLKEAETSERETKEQLKTVLDRDATNVSFRVTAEELLGTRGMTTEQSLAELRRMIGSERFFSSLFTEEVEKVAPSAGLENTAE